MGSVPVQNLPWNLQWSLTGLLAEEFLVRTSTLHVDGSGVFE
jgi:hypothetical protein